MQLKVLLMAAAVASFIACGAHPSAQTIAEKAKNVGVYIQESGNINEVPSYGLQQRNIMSETVRYQFGTAIPGGRPDSFIVNLPGAVVTEAKLFLLPDLNQASWHYFRADDPRDPKPLQASIEPITPTIFKVTPMALPESTTGYLCLYAQMPQGAPDRLYAVRLAGTPDQRRQ